VDVGQHLIVLLNPFASCSPAPTTFSEIAPRLH
jgi:hypothetical protein